MKTNLKRRVEGLERGLFSRRPRHSAQFDKDALAIYTGIAYLDAAVDPDSHEVTPTAVLLASADGSFYVGQSLGPNGGDVML